MADSDAQPPPGLLGNPFAVLGATTRTTVDELFELADTPERSALARVLSVPRSRLAAETSFLPGAADQASAVLAALHAGQRPDPASLPPLAAANLRAHLCAAGLATEDDLLALATAMPSGPDPALLGALDADRDAAGMPHVPPAALAEALEGLTDAHASVLVDACGRGGNGAGRLSRLVEAAPPGRPPPLLRRAAAAWTRRTATQLATLEEAANGAVAAWSRAPGPGLLSALDRTVRDWAALSRPQRLVDARAALDHPATLRALSRWRQSLNGAGNGAGAAAQGAAPARLLAELFGDLPGEGPDLQRQARNAASAGEEAVLSAHLLRLRELVTHLAGDVLPLRAQMAARPFGPGSRKAAGELWAAFDAAVNASTVSEAPWTEVLRLAPLLDAPPQPGRERGVASFYAGLVSRAEAAGRTELTARLRETLRDRRADAAVAEYDRRRTGGWRVIPVLLLPLVLPWQALRLRGSARRALRLLGNPAVRQRIEAEMAERRRRARPLQVLAGLAVLAVLGGLGAQELDTEYALHAPFRAHAAVSLASHPAPPAPAPFTPPPVPAPSLALPRLSTFPDRPGETIPGPALHTLTRAEVRWCLANIARWRAARDIAMPEDEPTVDALGSELQKRCANASVRRSDEDAVKAEAGRNQDRLRYEGEAMLGTASR